MKSISKDQEYDLIKQLIVLEKQLQSIDNLENDNGRNDLNASIIQVSKELSEIDSPQASIEILETLIRAFHQMKSTIPVERSNESISRDQGSIINDYFINKILGTINEIVNGEFHKLIIPKLNITSDPKDSFDRKQLITFFDNEIEILNKLEKINYLSLKYYYKGFVERLLKLNK